MRLLVLGGTRFVGPYVVRELIAAGHQVAIFHRGETESALTTGADHVHGDFADFEKSVPDLVARCPDVVVDLCAFRREEGGRVRRFKGVAQRAVIASSGDVYRAFGRLHRSEPGPPDPLPLREDSPLREVVIDEDYDKVGVEQEAQGDPEFPVSILRLPAIHGPGDYQHRLYRYVKRMDDLRPAIVLEDARAGWRWARGYVEDVAHAIALATTEERAGARIYNVADPVAFTEQEWVRQIADVRGWNGEVLVVPPAELPSALRFSARFDARQEYVVETSRIRDELGYAEKVVPMEALRRTIEWERANPPEKLDPEEWDYAAEDALLASLVE